MFGHVQVHRNLDLITKIDLFNPRVHYVLTFESVDEILWCDHSNETSSAVLLHGTICFSIVYKRKYEIFF